MARVEIARRKQENWIWIGNTRSVATWINSTRCDTSCDI